MKQLAVVAALTFAVAPAYSQGACPMATALVGPALPFDEAQEQLPKPIQKGEFETTAQFAARQQTYPSSQQLLVAVDEPRARFVYDADREIFRLNPLSFSSTVALWVFARQSTEQDRELLGTSDGDAIQLRVGEIRTETGGHVAQNAFGTSVQVTLENAETQLLFQEHIDNSVQRPAGSPRDLFGACQPFEQCKDLEIPASLAEAETLKPHMKLVALIQPRPPYRFDLKTSVPATFSRPTETNQRYVGIVGDIVCVGVTDGASRVLAHWSVR